MKAKQEKAAVAYLTSCLAYGILRELSEDKQKIKFNGEYRICDIIQKIAVRKSQAMHEAFGDEQQSQSVYAAKRILDRLVEKLAGCENPDALTNMLLVVDGINTDSVYIAAEDQELIEA